MRKHRTEFVKGAVEKLLNLHRGNSDVSLSDLLDTAIRIGMDNSHLVDTVYTYSVCSHCATGEYKYSIFSPGNFCIDSSRYIFSSQEAAETAAIAVISVLESQDDYDQ